MLEWQPIETAPKDGRFVILWKQGVIYPCIASYGYGDVWMPADQPPELYSSKFYTEPTHWLPIPDVPYKHSVMEGVGSKCPVAGEMAPLKEANLAPSVLPTQNRDYRETRGILKPYLEDESTKT